MSTALFLMKQLRIKVKQRTLLDLETGVHLSRVPKFSRIKE